MIKRISLFCIAILSAASLSGCFLHPYKVDIQQGNIITADDIIAIHNGMSAESVVARLGEPLLKNMYADGRMIYIYTYKHGYRKMIVNRMIITFSRGVVVDVQTDQDNANLPGPT